MGSISFKDIKILDVICPGVALIFTAARLVLRLQSGRVWWDDAVVLLSSLCLVLTATATGMHYSGPYAFSYATRLAAYYLIAEGFYLTLWTARISILFSIIRIVPEKSQKRFLYSAALAFVAVLIFLLAQVFWVCEAPNKVAWKSAPNPQCSLGLQVAVCQLVTDIISDVLLIVVPVRLLARTHLERGLKIRLVIIFSAAILTTVVSLVHAAYLLEVRGVDAIISAIVEISVSIIVSNLVVVVPAMYRALGWRAEDEVRRRGGRDGDPSYRVSSLRFGLGRSAAGGVSDMRTDMSGGSAFVTTTTTAGAGVSTVGAGTSTAGEEALDSENTMERSEEQKEDGGLGGGGGGPRESRVRWSQNLSERT